MIRARRLAQTPINECWALSVGRFVIDRLEAYVPLAHSLRHDFL
jgi:hypothetical protein